MKPRAWMKRRAFLAALSVFALGLAGCSGGDGGGGGNAADSASSGGEPGTWTVLQFDIADTNLEPYMMQDLDEAGAAGADGKNLSITALVDRNAAEYEGPVLGLDNWHGAKILDIAGGKGTVVKDLGPTNTGDPAVLSAFLADGIKAHQADHYALIMSDHGASWPGVGGDESAAEDSLSLAEIHDAISSALKTAGIDKLDFLGFDACLMSTYEVASTMQTVAERMVASQELEPGHGWDYHSLSVLADGSGTVDDLGNAIVDGFAKQADSEGTSAEITLAYTDLTKMPAVDKAVADFAGALGSHAGDQGPLVGRKRAGALGFGRSPDPTEDTQMTDLGSLAKDIGADAKDVSGQADALVGAIDAAVLKTVDGASTQGATGLSIYFPPEAGLANGDYQNVASAKAWVGFLDSYYNAGKAIPDTKRARAAKPGEAAQISFGKDGLTIVGHVDPAAAANLTDATINYGVVQADGSVDYIGEEPADLGADGTVTGTYDLTTLKMTDGTDTVTAFVTLGFNQDATSTIDVPMAYYAPGDKNGETYQDVLLEIAIDKDGNVTDETYYAFDDKTDMYGELSADPNGQIVPEVRNVKADGTEEWTATSDAGLFAHLPDIKYDLEPLKPGTPLQVDLVATDFGGNDATISAVTKVP